MTSWSNTRLEANIHTLKEKNSALEVELVNAKNGIVERTLHSVSRTNPDVNLSPFGEYATEKIAEWVGNPEALLQGLLLYIFCCCVTLYVFSFAWNFFKSLVICGTLYV